MTARQKPEVFAPFAKGARKIERQSQPTLVADLGPPLPPGDQEQTEKHELQQLWNVQFTEGEEDDAITPNEPDIDVILEHDEAADRELTQEHAPQIIELENDYADEDELGNSGAD